MSSVASGAWTKFVKVMTEPKKHGNKAPLWQDLLLLGLSIVGSGAVMIFALKQIDPNKQSREATKRHRAELQKRLGCNLKLNPYEEMLASEVINPKDIEVTMDDIGGLTDILAALNDKVIAPMQEPHIFLSSPLLKPTKGVLLYGPPGTGKTMLAKAIAKQSGANFMNIHASSIQSKWFGDTGKLVTAVFTLAWKLQPCIIFIDEVDAMLGKRTGQEHDAVTTIKTEFMQLWDGFVTRTAANVMVLAATNRPGDLDEAVLRRLPLSYEVGMPGASEREGILRVIIRKELEARPGCIDRLLLENKEDPKHGGLRPLERIALALDGFSGSDICELCKNAAYIPVLEMRHGDGSCQEIRPLTLEDLEAAIDKSKPSLLLAQQYAARNSTNGPTFDAQNIKMLQMLLALLSQSTSQARKDENGDT